MKFLKTVLSWFLHILNIPLTLLATFGITWCILPTIKETIIGETILTHLTESTIFWVSIISTVLLIISIIMLIIINKTARSKVKNFFIHLNTWSACILALALAIATFILINPIITVGTSIGVYKKALICTDLVLLVIFHIFSTKISRIINRKIQSYQTAKEASIVGRSSVIWVNFLKLIEILFPEILILFLLSLVVSWEIASYFTVILLGILIPLFGNIVCDFIARKEIIKDNKDKHQQLVSDVANKVKGK